MVGRAPLRSPSFSWGLVRGSIVEGEILIVTLSKPGRIQSHYINKVSICFDDFGFELCILKKVVLKYVNDITYFLLSNIFHFNN